MSLGNHSDASLNGAASYKLIFPLDAQEIAMSVNGLLTNAPVIVVKEPAKETTCSLTIGFPAVAIMLESDVFAVIVTLPHKRFSMMLIAFA